MPGESQIIAEALKALSLEALATIADAIIAYWENKIDAQHVHRAILIAIPKKRDLSQPKNWRPICLNDIFQKIISTLITKNLPALYVIISRENGTSKEDIQTPIARYGLYQPTNGQIAKRFSQGQRLPRWQLLLMLHHPTKEEPQSEYLGTFRRP
jgi:hypothetical protein